MKSNQANAVRPAEHWCCHPGCIDQGSFGFVKRYRADAKGRRFMDEADWYCSAHRAIGEAKFTAPTVLDQAGEALKPQQETML